MNSEVLVGNVTAQDVKQGISKQDKEYHLVNFFIKVSNDSGFKTSLPVIFTHFINKGDSTPIYKVGDEIRIGIDALEIGKREIKITKGVII